MAKGGFGFAGNNFMNAFMKTQQAQDVHELRQADLERKRQIMQVDALMAQARQRFGSRGSQGGGEDYSYTKLGNYGAGSPAATPPSPMQQLPMASIPPSPSPVQPFASMPMHPQYGAGMPQQGAPPFRPMDPRLMAQLQGLRQGMPQGPQGMPQGPQGPQGPVQGGMAPGMPQGMPQGPQQGGQGQQPLLDFQGTQAKQLWQFLNQRMQRNQGMSPSGWPYQPNAGAYDFQQLGGF